VSSPDIIDFVEFEQNLVASLNKDISSSSSSSLLKPCCTVTFFSSLLLHLLMLARSRSESEFPE
jgi:hypothetical protein